MNFASILSILEDVGTSILAGAAAGPQAVTEFDPTHPIVSAAAEAGAAAVAAVGGSVPVQEIAQAGLMIAKMFVSSVAPVTPATPATAS